MNARKKWLVLSLALVQCASAQAGGKLSKAFARNIVEPKSIVEPVRSDLIMAAWGGHLDLVKKLLRDGADINATTSIGNTALMLAAFSQHLEVVKVLLKAKADVNAINSNGDTAFLEALSYGHIEVAEEILRARPNVKTKRRDGSTAFHLASREGAVTLVQELLRVGADVTAEDVFGNTAIKLAWLNRNNNNRCNEVVSTIRKWLIENQVKITDENDVTILDGNYPGSFQKEFDDHGKRKEKP